MCKAIFCIKLAAVRKVSWGLSRRTWRTQEEEVRQKSNSLFSP